MEVKKPWGKRLLFKIINVICLLFRFLTIDCVYEFYVCDSFSFFATGERKNVEQTIIHLEMIQMGWVVVKEKESELNEGVEQQKKGVM